jgi:hypothetical protein
MSYVSSITIASLAPKSVAPSSHWHCATGSGRFSVASRQNKMKAVEIGGVEDHVHILLSLPATMAISKALQLIKGGSSKWVHETFPEHRLFAWQEKYGAFSVSESRMESIIQYIKGQAEHHRKMTFQEEFVALLKKHRIEYNERYLWD